MKKPIKILIIVFLIIGVLAVAGFLIVPNILIYRSCKEATEKSDFTYTEWDRRSLGTLENHQTITVEGITADIPDYMHTREYLIKDGDSEDSKEFKRRMYVDTKNMSEEDGPAYEKHMIMFDKAHTEKYDSDSDLLESIDKKTQERFLKKQGKEKMESMYDFYDLAYSLDCSKVNIFSSKECALLMYYSMVRSISVPSVTNTVYRIEDDSFKGFVETLEKDNGNMYSVYMYEKADPEQVHCVRIFDIEQSDSSKETVYKIINSLTLAED